jgi:hypothetical protein
MLSELSDDGLTPSLAAVVDDPMAALSGAASDGVSPSSLNSLNM